MRKTKTMRKSRKENRGTAMTAADCAISLLQLKVMLPAFLMCSLVLMVYNFNLYHDDSSYASYAISHMDAISHIDMSIIVPPVVPAVGVPLLDPDPDSTDCTELLKKFRADEIEVAKNQEGKNFRKSFVTVTNTDKPFYVATHDGKIDNVRAIIFEKQKYYEFELSKRVSELFDEKTAKGEESIMLDVGANIGWFSLLAAAHGATKVYAFEPNLQNMVRVCESLSINRWLHDDPSRDVVIPIGKGAGNREESKTLYAVDPKNPGTFSFLEEKAPKFEVTDKDGKVVLDENGKVTKSRIVIDTLEITTLDLFAERHGWFESKPSIGFFKLDVEHFELEVLQGAEKLLNSGLIETIAMELKSGGDENRKSNIIQMLWEAGYVFTQHGKWRGPHMKVTKVYSDWKNLLEDIHDGKMYGENVLFRLADAKQTTNEESR